MGPVGGREFQERDDYTYPRFPKFCSICKEPTRRVFKTILRPSGNSYICSAKCLQVFHNRLSPARPGHI